MNRDLFGTDGVRGLAGAYPLDREGAYRIGMAVATQFAQPGEQVVIGCDTRESSERIVQDVADGLTAAGVDAVVIGVVPTPGLAYITREHSEFTAGIMVTASHNPYEYNGIKVFDSLGGKLTDDVEAALNELIEQGSPERSHGTVSRADMLTEYEAFLLASAPDLQLAGMKLAVDTANGAASGLAAQIFTQLGASVTALFDQPDGRNINASCGATDTAQLREAVLEHGLDAGIALDGDADRLMLIDAQGRELTGDHILYLLGVHMGLRGVVATSMTNLGAEEAMNDQGITLERTAVGDRYVLEGLQQTGFRLGGEQSGHIILPELLATGDALLAAVQVLRAVTESNKSLAMWRDEVVILPQAIINVPLSDKSALQRPEVEEYMKMVGDRLADNGRVVIRPSGTEPLLRVMVEAEDAGATAQQIADELQGLLA